MSVDRDDVIAAVCALDPLPTSLFKAVVYGFIPNYTVQSFSVNWPSPMWLSSLHTSCYVLSTDIELVGTLETTRKASCAAAGRRKLSGRYGGRHTNPER